MRSNDFRSFIARLGARWVMGVTVFLFVMLAAGFAFACGNAMQVGVFTGLTWVWVGTGVLTVFVLIGDKLRAESLSPQSRLYLVLALFAVTSLSYMIYYGVTVDPDNWHWFSGYTSGFEVQPNEGQHIEF